MLTSVLSMILFCIFMSPLIGVAVATVGLLVAAFVVSCLFVYSAIKGWSKDMTPLDIFDRILSDRGYTSQKVNDLRN